VPTLENQRTVTVDFGLLIMPTPRPGNVVPQMMATNELLLTSAATHGLSAWFVDHFQFGDRPYLECFAQLAHSAGRFPGLRVGTLVLGQGYRNPALVAKIAASLQLLTGGKLTLGIGAGWKQDEYLAYGYPFPPAKQRLDELDEAIRIIKALWTEPVVTFTGRYHSVSGAICEPRPDPKPVLMVGGGGERRTLAIAAEHADWWNVDYVGPDDFARKLGILRQHCRRLGRDPDAIVPTYYGMVSLSHDPAKVITVPPPNYPPTAYILSGSPAEVTAKLRRFAEIGARHIQLTFLDYPGTEGIELFLSDVLPNFKEAA
jgi:alkanesulfonate monooxygenase SsuD/methylene tetrahydromethanopterin reductase-like flavin-dependent oxidoreductase (luciferase family)